MRIAQITDIHIADAGERPHDVDTRAHFQRVLQAVLREKPDHIVISGDLCFREARDEAYSWIRAQLEALPVPFAILAGNHDDQQVLQRYFPEHYHAETDELYFASQWGSVPVCLLDTARGTMSENQYQWLEASLPARPSTVVIFMHHPPLYCGVPHMDEQYAFREIPRIQALLRNSGHTFEIFCGHYHVERSLSLANQSVHITPSTFFQIDANQTDFAIDHRRPGYRMINIDGNDIKSVCRYV